MLYSPNKKPREFGFKQCDTHFVVNAATDTAKAFSFKGELLWELPCYAVGQSADWRNNSGDTPPGLYKLGVVYQDYERVGNNPAYDRTLMTFGWYTFDMVDLEGNEDGSGRAGICLHGGGSNAGWPGAWKPMQGLFATLGCLRMNNVHLRDNVLPLYKQGTVFVSVFQDDV
jgi:hypothetical protein